LCRDAVALEFGRLFSILRLKADRVRDILDCK